MKKRNRVIVVGLLLVAIAIVLPPLLAPLVHNHDSPRSALREAIYEDGHPYQSFIAFIKKGDYQDKEYGQRYDVYWYDYNNPAGDTATICYTKETENETYDVACGTGP